MLALFEGVATGAADGFGRIAGRPAATLLHLGPGLGNGLANLHNARRAHSPVVNIVGDHAISHRAYDAQLQSDIATVARNVSGSCATTESTERVGADARDTLVAAYGPPGRVATLILPADVSWSDGGVPVDPPTVRHPARRRHGPRRRRARGRGRGPALGRAPCAVHRRPGLLRGPCSTPSPTWPPPTGAELLCETFPARLERGAGRPAVERLGYLAEFAMMRLDGIRHLVLARRQVTGLLLRLSGQARATWCPTDAPCHPVAGPGDDLAGALDALGDSSAPPRARPRASRRTGRHRPTGALTAQTVCQTLGALLPEGAVVSDEGNTSGLFAPGPRPGRRPTTGCA